MFYFFYEQPFIGSFFYHLGCELGFANTKERVVCGVISEDSDCWHLFRKRLHVGHLGVMGVFVKLCHIYWL